MRRVYRENTWYDMEQADRENTIVIMPLGATEQHGHHLPIAADALFTEEITHRVLERAEKDILVTALPTLYVGVSVEHLRYPGTLTLEPTTYYTVLMDITKSLAAHGFKKLMFINGHGGNSGLVGTCMFDVRAKYGMLACTVDISTLITAADRPVGTTTPAFEDSHGGEMETAMILACRPDTVQLDKAVVTKPDRYMENSTITHMGPVGVGWSASDLAGAGSSGNPGHATAQQGNAMLDHIVNVACVSLRELNAMSADIATRS